MPYRPDIYDLDYFATGGSGSAIGGAVTGGTNHSVLFLGTAGILAQDNNQFYFNDAASGSASYVQLSVGTNGDFGGTDSINIYGQFDAYNPNSVINGGSGQAANLLLDGIVPGFSVSASRGTGASPSNLNTGDIVGMVGSWGYTNSAYTNTAAVVFSVTGATSTNLGGEIQYWTKADGGVLTQVATLTNTGFLGLGTTAPAALLQLSGNTSSAAWTTNGIALRAHASGASTLTDTTSTGTVAAVTVNSLGSAALAASSATTYTTAATLYISGAPTAGANVTLTNAYALQVASGASIFTGGTVTINGAISASAWTTAGIGFRTIAATYTDTSSSGTVTQTAVHTVAVPTLVASSATTYTNSATFRIAGPPVSSTNVTQTAAWALQVEGRTNVAVSSTSAVRFTPSVGATSSFNFDTTNSRLTIGSNGIAAQLAVTGAQTASSWTTNGVGIMWQAATYTDSSTAGSGTVTNAAIHGFAQPSINSTNATVTYTNAATIYIANAPAGTGNVTITNPYAFWIAAGVTRLDGGQVTGTRVVTGAGAITVTTADYLIVVNKASGAATTVNLMASPVTGTTIHVKDGKGDAATNNITLTPAAGNIDGAGTNVINTNYGSRNIVYNGTEWNVI